MQPAAELHCIRLPEGWLIAETVGFWPETLRRLSLSFSAILPAAEQLRNRMSPIEKQHDLGNESDFQNRVTSGEIKYHSRDSAPEPVTDPQTRKLHVGGAFKNNPTLLIILLDIMLVLVILLIVFPLIRPNSEADNFMGY